LRLGWNRGQPEKGMDLPSTDAGSGGAPQLPRIGGGRPPGPPGRPVCGPWPPPWRGPTAAARRAGGRRCRRGERHPKNREAPRHQQPEVTCALISDPRVPSSVTKAGQGRQVPRSAGLTQGPPGRPVPRRVGGRTRSRACRWSTSRQPGGTGVPRSPRSSRARATASPARPWPASSVSPGGAPASHAAGNGNGGHPGRGNGRRLALPGPPRGSGDAAHRGRGGGRPHHAGLSVDGARPSGRAASVSSRGVAPLEPWESMRGRRVPRPARPLWHDAEHAAERERRGPRVHRVMAPPPGEGVSLPEPRSDPR